MNNDNGTRYTPSDGEKSGRAGLYIAIAVAILIVIAALFTAIVILTGDTPEKGADRKEPSQSVTEAAKTEPQTPGGAIMPKALTLSSSSGAVTLYPEDISLSAANCSLKAGGTFDLKPVITYGEAEAGFAVTVVPYDAYDTSVIAVSADPDTASVRTFETDNVTTVSVKAKREGSVLITVYSGADNSLKATFLLNVYAENAIEYSVSDSSKVSVSNGVITALSAGNATVTASTRGGKTADCAVTVTSAEKKAKYKVGDVITFGSYEQDGDASNGKEGIVWRVIALEGDEALLISEYGLDCKKYNNDKTDVTWEKCTLRAWLNDTFIREAFTDGERTKICVSNLPADKNPNYGTSPGSATSDRIFLLSASEANRYLTSAEIKQCVPTAYAIKNGAWTSDKYFKNGREVGFWWLRTPGQYGYFAVDMNYKGEIYYEGVYSERCSVRPAVRISNVE